MGLKSKATVTSTPVASAPTPPVTQPHATKNVADKTVKGQVAMHAIICGYRTAAILTPVIAGDPKAATEVMHTLAHEIAQKVEAYAFHE